MRHLSPARATAEPGDAGFTLIEMLVVVSIIGILAAVAIPRYMAYARTSQTAEVGRVAGTIVAAITALAEQEGLGQDAVRQTFDGSDLSSDATPGSKSLLVLIPDFQVPAASKFNYVVSAARAQDGPQTDEVVYCIQATGRPATGVTPGGVVVYSTAPSSQANWDGRINREAYETAPASGLRITAGGYCKQDGTASPTTGG